MTFDQREISNFDGKPVILYEFTRGALAWRYCTADRDITLGADTYSAVPISDAGVHQSGQPSADNFEITLPSNAAVPVLYRGTPPSDRIWLKIRRMHFGDGEAAVVWVGSVVQATQRDEAETTLICQSLTSSFEGNGLRLSWQRSCPHMLYDSECKVDKELFRHTTTVAALDGITVQLASDGGKPDRWFSGGFLEWSVAEGTFERRPVEEQTGALLRLIGGTDGMTVGMTVNVYPGCPLTSAACSGKFNNIANYGGIIHLPGKSPFDGSNPF